MNTAQKLSHEHTPWVILVHYGDCVYTARCLERLAKIENTPPPHGVVVVDHGPGAVPIDYWKQFHPNVICIQNHSNPGFAAGCNMGAERAISQGAASLWFLNNDATLDEPILGKLAELASRFPDVALWGTYQFDGTKQIGCTNHDKWYAAASAKIKPTGAISIDETALSDEARLLEPHQSLSGASIFMTRSAWEKLGPWPEKFFLYWEDAAWCMRAHSLSMPIAIADLKIVHAGSATTIRRSPLSTFYGARNQLLLHFDAAPKAYLRRLFMKLYILQKCLFRGRFNLLKPTWDAVAAASKLKHGRDPRY